MPVFEGYQIRGGYVRFGSKADVCAAQSRVRFAPNSDRESGFPRKVMSALPPKADMCSALAHVCFGPKADIRSFIRSLRQPGAKRIRGSKDRELWLS